MKNKSLLLALIPAVALLIPTTNVMGNVNADETVTLSTANAINFTQSFNGNLKLSATTTYMISTVTYVDYVSSNARTRYYYFYDQFTGEDYIISDFTGAAYELAISTSNEVIQNAITDEEGNQVLFKNKHASPFDGLKSLNATKVNSYFTFKEVENGYVATANDLAYGVLNNPLTRFYISLEAEMYNWDKNTYEELIEDLTFTLDSNFKVTGASFNILNQDKWGAIRERFDLTIEKVTSIPTLQSVAPKMSEEDLLVFEEKISNFQDKIKVGNFKQHIDLPEMQAAYDTFYAFNNVSPTLPNMAISNVALNDATNGITYIGTVEEGGAYYPYAFSPQADKYSQVTELSFSSLDAYLPSLKTLGSEFFVKTSENTYIFDIESFNYADFNFCDKILRHIFSGVDPLILYSYTYIDDLSYDYQFESLTIQFDENDIPSVTLTFEKQGYRCRSISTFSKFGEVDLTKEETLKSVIPFIENIYLHG